MTNDAGSDTGEHERDVTPNRVTEHARAREAVLRSYQVEAIQALRSAFARVRRVLFVLPTGGGKTEVGAAEAVATFRRGEPVLWLAHRRELVNQAVVRLERAGIPKRAIGVLMGDDGRARPDAMVQVGSVDTVRRRDLPPAALVVLDEAHHAPAATWAALVDAYEDSRILGLTATPWRRGTKQLAAHFDELVPGPKPAALVADGWICAARVFAPPNDMLPDLTEVRTGKSEDGYNVADLSRVVRRREIVGCIVEHWLRLAEGRRTVAYAVDVAHATELAARFCEAGVAAEVLTGETPKPERDAMLARLTTGPTRVVVNCQVLTEGWDAPQVKCAILACPTRSLTRYLQMAGRILRPWEGVAPLVLDHAGNAHTFGLPHTDRALGLAVAPPKRGRGVGAVMVRTETGELVEVAGELVEVTGEREPDRCDDCGKALGMGRSSVNARSKRPHPWNCFRCAAIVSLSYVTDDGRRRGAANLLQVRGSHGSPEQRAEWRRRGGIAAAKATKAKLAVLTQEQRALRMAPANRARAGDRQAKATS